MTEKLENFHLNYYDLEQILTKHTNVFQDYEYIFGNLQKEKERLFTRGKWTEWQLRKEQQDSETLDLMLKNKEQAFFHMLPNVKYIIQKIYRKDFFPFFLYFFYLFVLFFVSFDFKDSNLIKKMDEYQDTINEILKVQVDGFFDTVSRIFLDSLFYISRETCKMNMSFHFHNKEFEADLKILPSFETLYKRTEDP